MSKVVLGSTGLEVDKNGFGALPIQRVSMAEAVKILRKALANGINFYDSAHVYSDSEEKMGEAFHADRDKIVIATKVMGKTVDAFWSQLETSLKRLRTDYIDIYQFHNPGVLPRPGDETGLYDAMLEAKKQGKIRHIGLSNHRLPVAMEAVESGLYESLQFPFSYLSSDKDIELVNACKKHNVAFVAMKALSGGIITNAAAAYAWLNQFDNVVPIWGIQRESELDDFLAYSKQPPALTGDLQKVIDTDRAELTGEFCRGCAYCEPCPVGIQISTSARMTHLIRRSPSKNHLTEEAQEKMRRIEDCIHCGQCKAQCPYGLDAAVLLEKNYQDYKEILAGKPL